MVEDNPITSKMVRVTLETEGFRVLEAVDGQVALETLGRESPDLILQDLLLPDMDGFELVGRIRSLAGLAGTPIIAVSGLLSRLEVARTGTVGFTDVLTKPVEPSRLVECVRRHTRPKDVAAETPAAAHVLVVDDDPSLRELSVLRLEHEHFRVTAAQNGDEALSVARRDPPDAVLSDVLMPGGMDGFELCLAFRRDPKLRHIPVLLVSAKFTEEEDRALGRQAGADDLLVRSPGMADEIAGLRAALERRGPRTEVKLTTRSLPRHYRERLVHQLERQALLNAQLAQSASAQAAALGVLGAVGRSLAEGREVSHALTQALYCCMDAGGVSHGLLYLTTEAGTLELGAHIGLSETSLDAARAAFGHAKLLQEVALGTTARQFPGPAPSPEDGDFLAKSGSNAAVLIPLRHGGTPVGLLFLGSNATIFVSDEWRDFGQALTSQLGTAIALAISIRHRSLAEQALQGAFAQVRGLLDRLESAREDERTRIARDLHDQLGQTLTAIRMDLTWVREHQPQSSDAANRLEQTLALVDRGIADVRRISRELRPMELDVLGLKAALEAQVAEFRERAAIPCTLAVVDDVANLPPDRAVAVFRIVQEALTNVLRHAKARSATVALRREGQAIVVAVEDDGVGIPAAGGPERTLGIPGMRQRARALGGELTVQPSPSGGTRLVARVPLGAGAASTPGSST